MLDAEPGVAPELVSYTSDGRVIESRPITILISSELVGSGHGEWIQTGNHEFASTVFFLPSTATVEFSHLVKLTSTIKLNHTSNQFTMTGTVSVFNPDGTLLVSFPFSSVFKRVVAGQ
jgi:hypothetical protein